MELLIPGLILVALMVYASTRIKRSAAAAFESETIETDEFIIKKPDGFLSVLGGDPKYAYEAYSRDFGTGDDANTRLAHVYLFEGSPEIAADRAEDGLPPEQSSRNTKETIEGVEYQVYSAADLDGTEGRLRWFKTAEKNGRIWTLEIRTFDSANQAEWLNTFIEGFKIK